MKFTLDLSHHPWTRDRDGHAPRRTLETARAADAAGIDAIWVSEDPEGWDAFAVLGAIAAMTENAALGTSVTSPYPRHPNLLAAAVATLDRFSGGRAALGLGRGQIEWHRDALGVETGSPLAALGETVTLLRDWWEPAHRASSPPDAHFQVRDWERVIHPLQARVPIYLAAAGPRALDLAGAVCDGAIFNALASDEFLREAVPRVRGAATAAGRDPATLSFILRTSVRVVASAATERKALDRDKNLLAILGPLPGMDRLVQSRDFDIPALLRDLRAIMRTEETLAAGGGFPALRRAGDLTAAREAIPDALIRQIGIVGSLPEVHERLRGLAALGITHVGVAPPGEPTAVASWEILLAALRA
jgi:alkanesulfonate monooxygenase SsuD/methylene tetrahydromethanopterin reductase-like flavin-dependent oxidoreductase (luciferase family)